MPNPKRWHWIVGLTWLVIVAVVVYSAIRYNQISMAEIPPIKVREPTPRLVMPSPIPPEPRYPTGEQRNAQP